MGKLLIDKMILGMVQTNCYLAVNTETREAIAFDPADRADLIIERLKELQATLSGVFLTHGHFDHVGAVEKLKETYGMPVYALKAEKSILENPAYNLSGNFGTPFTVKADHFLKDQEILQAAGFGIQVYHTPGHTAGGACYYLPEEQVLFSGDTLFYESVGRSDFPTGSMAVLTDSVRMLFQELPEETKVYPGHDRMTDIAHEKMYNPFL